MRWVMTVVATLGCGRIGFDTVTTTDAAKTDAANGSGGPRFVQVISPTYTDTASLQAPIAYAADHLLVTVALWNMTTETITVNDSTDLTWHPLAIEDTAPTCQTQGQLWYAVTTATTSATVTITQSAAGTALGLFVAEYAGVDTSSPLVSSVGQIAPSSSNAMSTPVGTTSVPALVVAFFNDTLGHGTMLAGNGFAARAVNVPFYAMLEDNAPIGTGTGTYQATASLPAGISDKCWVAAAAAFRIVP